MADPVVYVITLLPVEGREFTPQLIHAHVAHLRALDDAGALVLAGPLARIRQGLVVVRAEDAAAAERIAEADPFVAHGVRTYRVDAWHLATRENDYLDAPDEGS